MSLKTQIEAAKEGNARAQAELYKTFSGLCSSVCSLYARHADEARGLMNDGFLNFFENIVEFEYRNDRGLKNFLVMTVKNVCLNYLKTRDLFEHCSEESIPDSEISPPGLDRLTELEIRAQIMKLPIGYRTVFNLYHIEGYEHSEIAETLNICEGTSRSQLYKAKKLLQEYILKENLYEKEKKDR